MKPEMKIFARKTVKTVKTVKTKCSVANLYPDSGEEKGYIPE